jgi:hypothetical protein
VVLNSGMATYTITLSDEHVSAIQQKIASMPKMMDPATNQPVPVYADEGAYLAGLIRNDIVSMIPYLPAAKAAHEALAQAQADRDEALKLPVNVTKSE